MFEWQYLYYSYSAEKYSKATFWRRKKEGKKVGLKPDLMIIARSPAGLEFEVAYLECSRILCSEEKIIADEIKLLRECNTGMDFAYVGCNKLTEKQLYP